MATFLSIFRPDPTSVRALMALALAVLICEFAPLVLPAGAPTGISGIRVRAARATRHSPGPAFKSLAVDGPVAYPTVGHRLYTPCPNGLRDVVNRLFHALD